MPATSDPAVVDVDALTARWQRALCPSGVRLGFRAVDEADEALLAPCERIAIRNAGAKRRREFSSGRALLRDMLQSNDPIPRLDSGRPRLPAGWIGSLSHDDLLVGASLSRRSDLLAVGLDIETDAVVDEDFSDVVLRSDESGLDPLTAFVVKESAYKVFSALGEGVLEFHDVRITLAGAAFRASIVSSDLSVSGRVITDMGRVAALSIR